MSTASVPTTQDLGKEVGRYSASFSHTWGAVAFAAVLVILAPVIFIGLPIFWSGLGPGMAEVLQVTPFLQYLPALLGGVLLLVAGLRAFGAWREWVIGVTLYERGFEYRDRQGVRHLGWQDIENFTQHITRHMYYGFIPVGSTYSFALNDRSGGTIILDERIGHHKELGEQILLQMADQQLPACLAEIRAGKLLEFGALAVDQSGVRYGGKALPWNEVKEVKVQNGRITVFKQGGMLNKWVSLSGEEVPNAYVFGKIAQQLTPRQ